MKLSNITNKIKKVVNLLNNRTTQPSELWIEICDDKRITYNNTSQIKSKTKSNLKI